MVTMLCMGMLVTIVMARFDDGGQSMMMIAGDDEKVMMPMIATMTLVMPFFFPAKVMRGEDSRRDG